MLPGSISIMGIIPRQEFKAIIGEGGNIGPLVASLGLSSGSESISGLLSVFSNLAVTTYLLGITLGLFDYIADKLKFDNAHKSRQFYLNRGAKPRRAVNSLSFCSGRPTVMRR
jgi:amino acid permease